MTDIDTAAIRAAMDRIGRDGNGSKLVNDLCDALDAARAGLGLSINALVVARAELARVLASEVEFSGLPGKWVPKARAEAAERHLADLQRDYDLMESERDAADDRRDEMVEDLEVERQRAEAAEARIAELEADITVIDDLASGDRAQMRAELNARPHDACLALLADAVARAEAAEAELADCKIEGLDQ